MQGRRLLHKFLKESSFNAMHDKTRNSLLVGCEGLLKSKKLSVTGIGRALEGATTDKHSIKRIDRLVSNPALEENRDLFYKHLAGKVVPTAGWCIILVDTSCLSADSKFQLIRASLALDGRAFTLYEVTYENGSLSEIWESFLKGLSAILPAKKGRVIIITDAGFHNKWFHLVKRQGWDFIGRVRQEKKYTVISSDESFLCKDLHKIARKKPTYHGSVILCKKSRYRGVKCNLYSVKKKLKGRKMKTKLGHIKQGKYSKTTAAGQKEPWVLASSLPINIFNPEEIVRLYSYRMQIEESFRDMKNSKSGLGFKHTLTKGLRRLNALLLMAAIANFILWSIGVMAEQKGWHFKCQSNTSKKRTLSLFNLGSIILKSRHFQFTMSEIELSLKNIVFPSPTTLMERQL